MQDSARVPASWLSDPAMSVKTVIVNRGLRCAATMSQIVAGTGSFPVHGPATASRRWTGISVCVPAGAG